MPLSPSIRTQIGTLVIATSIVQLANGFFGTFISLRVAINLGLRRPGLVLSAYFAGFTFGALAAGSSNGSVTFARTPRFAGMVLLPFPVCAHSIGFGYS